ncbi:glutamate/gamma-aminobutyrate family transporter YjeM [Periweissella cryptocerci]|uniref:Glutamate/gamma-aminobutyrate family transporter YjeM n=1 Tax=Periweissella cryptocerci TaxID=2506420 RepID=A0A4P6YW60_9LACO|nr:glutamate/gamma-aminobutyrate family transporter YjeM [Periweissella cryptocerci]QBO37021.1 glutamate/gamma-aminobutyrate family transporter YjeM [Periweissella cryptocerci]
MDKKKIGLLALTMMMFTTIFGFANGPVAFLQMGFASIIWYIIGALLYFLPTSMMYAEFGATYKESKGGLYSWMEHALGVRMAFIATFIGLASWIVWMIGVAAKVWIPLSTLVFGHDTTQTWSILGMNSTQTVGVLGVLFVLVITFFVNRGVQAIAKISSIGGMAVMALNVIFLVSSIIILVAHGGHFAEPIHGLATFTTPANTSFQSPLAMMSFALYAVFAYGGLEQMGGIMESVDKAEKTYPKAATIATVVIGLGYALSILLWGVSTSWAHLHGMGNAANLGNITYVLMNNLGVELGGAFGLSHAAALGLGSAFARFAGISMFLAYLGSFFFMTYAPIKSFILGTPRELWPSRMVKLNKAEVPSFSIWIQATVVSIFIIAVSFGGDSASTLYQVLTNMGNVSSTLPYVFLVIAFPMFKRLKNVDRPFVAYKSMAVTYVVSTVVAILLVVSIAFTVAQPIIAKDYFGAFWTVIGPVFFGIVAWAFYAHGEKKQKQN